MKVDIESLRPRITDLLEPARNKGFFLCPLCGSGTGPKKTGAFRVDPQTHRGHCHACGFHGDTVDLVGKMHGLDTAQAFAKAKEILHMADVDGKAVSRRKDLPPPSRADYSQYLAGCQKELAGNPEALSYLHGRGFTDEIITRFGLGYDAARHVLTIPYGKSGAYYSTRAVGADKAFWKPPTSEAGPEPLYNAAALYATDDVVFVVESQLDAVSVEQAGGRAVALCGTGFRKLLGALEQKPTDAILVVALDNDDRGISAASKLAQALRELGQRHIVFNVAGDTAKDANEALQRDSAALNANIKTATAHALAVKAEQGRERAARAEDERDAYLRQHCTASYVDAFVDGVMASVDTPCFSTGFPQLDNALDGGLYEGLHILGAISSLGKTTLLQQLADQLEAQGVDVVFFSLEMGRFELMAKSISRITRERCDGNTANAKTARGITNGSRYAGYSNAELDLIRLAVEEYRKFAHHSFVVEGSADTTLAVIRSFVEQHIKITTRRPVVMLDYLQIIPVKDKTVTDKQRVDAAVSELRRLARDCKIPVIAISSLNRESYKDKISMAAFKESGGVEYSADVLLGLQFRNMGQSGGGISPDDIDRAKKQLVRDVEVKVLKSRNGATGGIVPFHYAAMFNYFEEDSAANGRVR